MLKNTVVTLFISLSMLGSQVVVAAPGPGPDRNIRQDQRHAPPPPPVVNKKPAPPSHPQAHQGYQPPRNTHPPKGYNHYKFSQHRNTPYGDIRPGHRIPHQYNHKQYVVNDWKRHRLYAPPSGYHWVQTGHDYVLVAIASGIIANILLGH